MYRQFGQEKLFVGEVALGCVKQSSTTLFGHPPVNRHCMSVSVNDRKGKYNFICFLKTIQQVNS